MVHVLSQDLVQAGAVVAHGSSPTGSPRQDRGGRLRRRSEARQTNFVLRVERGLVGAERTGKIRFVCSRRKRVEAESKPQDSLTLLRSFYESTLNNFLMRSGCRACRTVLLSPGQEALSAWFQSRRGFAPAGRWLCKRLSWEPLRGRGSPQG